MKKKKEGKKRKEGRKKRWKQRRTEIRTEGQKHGRTEERTDGQKDGNTDGRKDENTYQIGGADTTRRDTLFLQQWFSRIRRGARRKEVRKRSKKRK